MRVGLIGATGALGQELLAALGEAADEPELRLEPPVLLASNRTANEAFPWGSDEELPVEAFERDAVRGLDAAIVATPPDVATTVVSTLRELGIPAIDASRAHRSSAPLYFTATQTTALASAPVVALPGPDSLQLARVLAALAPLGPRWARATVLRAASGAGRKGVTELAESTGKLLNGQEPESPLLGHRLAFNAVPQAGAFTGEWTEAELDLAREVPALTGLDARVSATVMWAPWFYAHLQSVQIGFAQGVSLAAVRARLEGASGVKLVDAPAESVYPMPSIATGDEAVLVGRLRVDTIDSSVIDFVSAMDNVRAMAVHAVDALRALARARAAH